MRSKGEKRIKMRFVGPKKRRVRGKGLEVIGAG
jgi:hypothetical protein